MASDQDLHFLPVTFYGYSGKNESNDYIYISDLVTSQHNKEVIRFLSPTYE